MGAELFGAGNAFTLGLVPLGSEVTGKFYAGFGDAGTFFEVPLLGPGAPFGETGRVYDTFAPGFFPFPTGETGSFFTPPIPEKGVGLG